MFAYSAGLPDPVAEILKKYRIPESSVGLLVSPLKSDTAIISHNIDKPFNPASVMKLLPTLAALEILSPAYQWSTNIYTDGQINSDVLNGNLYIQGGGDPYMTIESYWVLLQQVRSLGIREIKGYIIIDNEYFSIGGFDSADFDGKP